VIITYTSPYETIKPVKVVGNNLVWARGSGGEYGPPGYRYNLKSSPVEYDYFTNPPTSIGFLGARVSYSTFGMYHTKPNFANNEHFYRADRSNNYGSWTSFYWMPSPFTNTTE